MMCCILICFLTLICYSMGKTTESHSLPEDKEMTTLDSFLNGNRQVGDDNSTSSGKQVDGNPTSFEKQDNERDRSGQSRMLSLQKLFTTTTTMKPTAYDYWSFFTTPRRPLISYRDYPGKPGVATWKEISSTGVKDNRKDRKIEDPTAESVSSNSPRWRISSCLSAVLILLNFCAIHNVLMSRNFGMCS